MATRRTSDSTRSPKPAAAPPTATAAKPAKSAADPKPSSRKPGETQTAAAAVTPPATPVAATSPAPAKRVTKPNASKASAPAPRMKVSEDTRRGMIAESAYLRAERRGFAPGHEAEDWLAAEKEVDALLNASTGASSQ